MFGGNAYKSFVPLIWIMMSSDTQKLAEWCKEYYSDADSVIHRWLHIENVAKGAAFFVRMAGGDERRQELAYVAGLLHDVTRKRVEEKDDHDKTGAERADMILREYSYSDDERGAIVKSIRDHRGAHSWENDVHVSVFLADKLLEHMGSIIAFRGGIWVGESGNIYKGSTPAEKILSHYSKAEARVFDKRLYPEYTHKLVDYQIKWVNDSMSALRKGEPWAVDMNERMFYAGKAGINPEKVIESFEPKDTMQKKYLDETKEYLNDPNLSKYAKLMR
jgi:hypothetical protein